MKDKANKGYWQRLAKIYAPLMESDKKFYNAICGYIRDYLKSDMNVLELACGTGQLSFPLSDCTNSWTASTRPKKESVPGSFWMSWAELAKVP